MDHHFSMISASDRDRVRDSDGDSAWRTRVTSALILSINALPTSVICALSVLAIGSNDGGTAEYNENMRAKSLSACIRNNALHPVCSLFNNSL
jgi:hypothetical protein